MKNPISVLEIWYKQNLWKIEKSGYDYFFKTISISLLACDQIFGVCKERCRLLWTQRDKPKIFDHYRTRWHLFMRYRLSETAIAYLQGYELCPYPWITEICSGLRFWDFKPGKLVKNTPSNTKTPPHACMSVSFSPRIIQAESAAETGTRKIKLLALSAPIRVVA